MAKFSESKILFWLASSGISVRKQVEAVRAYGNVTALWEAFSRGAGETVSRLGDEVAAALAANYGESNIDYTLERLKNDGIGVITRLNPLFPELLAQPEVAAPLSLYYRGSLEAFGDVCVAVVGTRACTPYGKEMAKRVASDLAENGVTVVSGLATGIDAYAHEAALDAGGKTIAVLGSGLNKITPVGNERLFEKILEGGGLVLSEYPPDRPASKYTFPERNRLISGLCTGVVVVEAAEKSGALITASFALEQNREVFAVPGNVTSARSKGCLDLIHSGANMVRNGYDVLEYLSIEPITRGEKSEIILDKEEKKLYSLLEEGVKSFDALVEGSLLPPPKLSEILLKMELDGIVERQSSNTYALKL